jgi:hypothetical protein
MFTIQITWSFSKKRKLKIWGFYWQKNLTKWQGASSNWPRQYLNSRNLTFSCALGKALQFWLQTWYIMMNCCIRDAILFCARDAIYNRDQKKVFCKWLFLHEFGSCCLENLSFCHLLFFATFYCFLCVDPKIGNSTWFKV